MSLIANCVKCLNVRMCDEFSKLCLDCEKELVAAAFEADSHKKAGVILNALLPKIRHEEVDADNDFNVPDSDRRYHGDDYTGE